MKYDLVRRSALFGSLVAALTIFTIVQAAPLEEIVVTAQKRAQSLQSVGISVTAYTGKQLTQMGIVNSTDVTSMTPGLEYTVPNAAGSQINFFLRGVGLNDFTDADENPVATYVDGVYHGAMGGLSFQLFDLQRVEVLRGPQGTLYGRNTTGGLIHFITQKPTDTFQGYAKIGLGSYGEVQYEGAVSGPIREISGLTARFSMSVDQHHGYVHNVYPGGQDYNSENAKAGRAQLQYVNGDFSALVKFHGSFAHNNQGAWKHQSTMLSANGNDSLPLPGNVNYWGTCPGCDAFGYKDTSPDPWTGNYDRKGHVNVVNWGVDGTIKWKWGNINLVSITGLENVRRLEEEDTEASPYPLINPTFGAHTRQITEELRASGPDSARFRWQAGFYYFDNRVIGDYRLDVTNLGLQFFQANYTQQTNAYAFFGHVEYDLTPKWTLIGGVRYSQERKTMNYSNIDEAGVYAACTVGVVPIVTALTGVVCPVPLTYYRPAPNDAFVFNQATVGKLAVQDHSAVTAKAEIDWHPTDNLMLYASATKGSKSAGFNTGFLDATYIFASNTPQTIPFGPETLYAYEAGFKSTLFNGTTRLNAGGFYYNYRNMQTFSFVKLNEVIFNTASTVYGGEVELETSPWQGWDFMGGLALLDATAHNILSPSGDARRDRRMVAAPKVSFNAMARYQWPMWGGNMAVIATTNYRSKAYYDIQNLTVSEQGAYIIGNMRLQYTSGGGHWTTALSVNNVANTAYKVYTFDFTGLFGFNQISYNKPRWVLGSVQYNW